MTQRRFLFLFLEDRASTNKNVFARCSSSLFGSYISFVTRIQRDGLAPSSFHGAVQIGGVLSIPLLCVSSIVEGLDFVLADRRDFLRRSIPQSS